MTRVSINAGLLQMIVNGLKRDFAEGKTIRGEWVEDIERDALAIEDAAAEPNRTVELSRDDVIRMAREAGAGVALCMSSPPRISDALFRGKALETFTRLVIAEFLQRTGQYVTNDASREAAIAEAQP